MQVEADRAVRGTGEDIVCLLVPNLRKWAMNADAKREAEERGACHMAHASAI
jgi:hypothetical protein